MSLCGYVLSIQLKKWYVKFGATGSLSVIVYTDAASVMDGILFDHIFNLSLCIYYFSRIFSYAYLPWAYTYIGMGLSFRL